MLHNEVNPFRTQALKQWLSASKPTARPRIVSSLFSKSSPHGTDSIGSFDELEEKSTQHFWDICKDDLTLDERVSFLWQNLGYVLWLF